MGEDPYKAGMVKEVGHWERVNVVGKLVLILDTVFEKRGLDLIYPYTRALPKNEIHELLVTDEKGASPGKKVNRTAGFAFFEIERGGIIVVGDKVLIENEYLGEVAGFDESHMPNHLNILIKAQKRVTGADLRLHPENEVSFHRGNKVKVTQY